MITVISIGTAMTMYAAASMQQVQVPSRSEDVVVYGRSPDALDRYIDQLTQTRGDRQVARWNRPVCVRLLGLDLPHQNYVQQRMAAIGRPLKIKLVNGGCRADTVVVFTREMDRFAQYVVKKFPRLFQDLSSGVGMLPAMREKFLQPRPVRWINASRTGPAVGGDLAGGVNSLYSASRLQLGTRENAERSFVLVDLGGMARLSWAQLVDYLSIVMLTNPDPDARYADDTIMAMFRVRDEGGTPPPSMTRTDRAYLAALYGTSVANSASSARIQIRSAMRRKLKSETEQP